MNVNDVLTKKEWQAQSAGKKDEIATDVADDRVQ